MSLSQIKHSRHEFLSNIDDIMDNQSKLERPYICVTYIMWLMMQTDLTEQMYATLFGEITISSIIQCVLVFRE